jgi:hypothetical protein
MLRRHAASYVQVLAKSERKRPCLRSDWWQFRLLPAPRERSGDWLKLNSKQFGRLRACGRRRGRAAIRKEKRRPAWLAWYAAPSAAAWTD